MLNKDRRYRLGANGDMDEVLTHPFFADLDMNMLLQKKIPAPYVPPIKDPHDLNHFDSEVTGQDLTESYIEKKAIKEIKQHDK